MVNTSDMTIYNEVVDNVDMIQVGACSTYLHGTTCLALGYFEVNGNYVVYDMAIYTSYYYFGQIGV